MLRQLIKFSLVGVLNTAIHVGVFNLLFYFMQYLLAQSIGFLFAVTNSYYINKKWTFKSRDRDVKREFTRFMIVNLVSLSVNLGCLAALVELYHFNPRVAQLLTVVVSLAVNFTGNKFWTFRGR